MSPGGLADLAPHRIGVVAGSAGAIPPMLELVRRLAHRDRACLFIIYHRAGDHHFDWSKLLPKDSGFRAVMAEPGLAVERNHVYYPHLSEDLIVRDGRLDVFPPAQRLHPNIDRLLISLAAEYGPRVVATLLSGYGRDGVEGLRAVQRAGGVTVAVDPSRAQAPNLPFAGIDAGVVDLVLSPDDIVDRVLALVEGERPHLGKAFR
ncbi:MAG: hypothetical protein LC624_06285 [Halobacteriales archaeon]|nr:hypothetical protein [Halobacteriales archaeon]